MNIMHVSRNAKATGLGVLIVCAGFWGTASAANPAVNSVAGVRATIGVATTQTDSSTTGFELDYFHAYKATKTYAIRLKNGLRASFDFEHGTATLYYGLNKATVPLDQALLQANNGNVEAASDMYNQMYQDVTSAHADAIMALAGGDGIATDIIGPPRTRFPGNGFGDPLWSVPSVGACDPIPDPCSPFSDNSLSNWGSYDQWWGSSVGAPPPTIQPPRPDGCAPNDIDCILWEHDRKNACDGLFLDSLEDYGMAATAGVACGAAIGSAGGFGATAAACVGALAGLQRPTYEW